ncbi:hypothetical protein [Streptomyces sp. NPDC057686]|uniref:hypothetical protein n=1 Tax=Streptomyces sp. NPDC057686 TaxID=3346212 RepID=UPI0036CD2299
MTHPFRTRRFLVFAASTAAAAGAVLLPTGAFAAPVTTAHTVVAADSPPANPCDGPGNMACSSGPQTGTIGHVDEGGGAVVVDPGGTPPAAKAGQGRHGPGKGGKVHPGKNLPVLVGGTDAVGWVHPPNGGDVVCDVAPCGPSTQPRIEAL